MNTRLRLLALALTFAALFALSWYVFVYERPQPQVGPPPKVKTTEELLIGTWEIVEQDPPIPPHVKATTEYTKDGKHILRVRDHRREYPPSVGVYQLTDTTLRIDFPADKDSDFTTWITTIQMLDADSLILVSRDQEERMKRMVCKRIEGK